MLKLYLEESSLWKNFRTIRLLEIAPRSTFKRYCAALPHVTYVSSDLQASDAMVLSDLTSMGMKAASFDIIVCLHVMEHIVDDLAAMFEIRRLLKPTGFGLLMVPVDREHTFEDPAIQPEEYERFYGQHDHVRRCGLDYGNRMRAAGLDVEIVDIFAHFPAAVLSRYGLYGDDRFFFKVGR